MAKRTRKPTVQVFIVSWFPMYSKDAATIMCLSRERANASAEEIRKSFVEQCPGDYNPQIRIDREERPIDY